MIIYVACNQKMCSHSNDLRATRNISKDGTYRVLCVITHKTRESRLSGMGRGLRGNVGYGDLVREGVIRRHLNDSASGGNDCRHESAWRVMFSQVVARAAILPGTRTRDALHNLLDHRGPEYGLRAPEKRILR